MEQLFACIKEKVSFGESSLVKVLEEEAFYVTFIFRDTNAKFGWKVQEVVRFTHYAGEPLEVVFPEFMVDSLNQEYLDEHADIDGEEMRKVAKESRTKYVFGIFDKPHELAYQAKSQPEPNKEVCAFPPAAYVLTDLEVGGIHARF